MTDTDAMPDSDDPTVEPDRREEVRQVTPKKPTRAEVLDTEPKPDPRLIYTREFSEKITREISEDLVPHVEPAQESEAGA